MIIRERLRALREERKFSQGEVEKRTGLLRCYISRVENGLVRVQVLDTIGDYLYSLRARDKGTVFSLNSQRRQKCGLSRKLCPSMHCEVLGVFQLPIYSVLFIVRFEAIVSNNISGTITTQESKTKGCPDRSYEEKHLIHESRRRDAVAPFECHRNHTDYTVPDTHREVFPPLHGTSRTRKLRGSCTFRSAP